MRFCLLSRAHRCTVAKLRARNFRTHWLTGVTTAQGRHLCLYAPLLHFISRRDLMIIRNLAQVRKNHTLGISDRGPGSRIGIA
jgi:hypothetical protein